MPSPIAHSLAGLAVGWLSDRPSPQGRTWLRNAATPLVLWCVLLAAIPDADLLLRDFHRMATHSVAATALVLIMALVVTGKVTRHVSWRIVLALAAAHATHLLLDWLGTDRNPPAGLQMFWPFSSRFYVSGWELFPPLERGRVSVTMLAINGYAAIWELILMGPIAVAAWVVRRRRKSLARTSGRDDRRPPSGGAADTRGTSGRPALRARRSESQGRRPGL